MPRITRSERISKKLKNKHGIRINKVLPNKFQAYFGAAMLIESFDFQQVVREAPRLKKEYLAAKAALVGIYANEACIRTASMEALARWSQALTDAAAYKAFLFTSKP